MGLGTRAFWLVIAALLLPTLPACTTCVGSDDQPAPRVKRSAHKRSNRIREKTRRHTVQVKDAQRRYLVQTPREYKKGRPTPLFVLFTSTGQAPERFSDKSNIMAGAAKLGYLLAIPAAQGSWKHELCPTASGSPGANEKANTQGKAVTPVAGAAAPAQEPTAKAEGKPSTADAAAEAGPSNDDVAFFAQMLKQITKEYGADPHRTYLIGMGDGAAFAERVAQQLPDKVSGIVSVGSTATCDRSKEDKPAQPVTALIIDEVAGGPDAGQLTSASTAYWFLANQCPGAPGSVNSKVDVSCAKGSRLRHVVVSGLKHGWTVKVGRKYTIRYIHEFFGGV